MLSFHLSFPLRYPNPRTRTASLSWTTQMALLEAERHGRALIGEEAGAEGEAEDKSSSPQAERRRRHRSLLMRGSPCSHQRA